MAGLNSLVISPTSGSGNATVSLSAGINAGRGERSNVIRGVAGNNVASDEYTIYEDPMPTAAVWLPASVNPQISGNGGQVILQIDQQGTNSRGISSLSIGDSGGYTPSYQCQYKTRDSGSVWTNFTPGTPIPGDPGFTWVYDLRILITVSQNPSTTASRSFSVSMQLYDMGAPLTNTITQLKRELIHYTVNVGSIIPVDPSMGSSTQWRMGFYGAEVDTLIQGNFKVSKNSGDFDICNVNGIVNDYGENSLLIYNEQGSPWIRNPDEFDGSFSGWNGSGTSQDSGYVCDGVTA